MILLKAPWPLIDVITVLPNPQFNDFEHQVQDLVTKRTISGKAFTYVRSNEDRALSMEFLLTREKKLELRAFLRLHYANKMALVDHNGNNWIVNLTENPFQFTQQPKEVSLITLQFQGTLVP